MNIRPRLLAMGVAEEYIKTFEEALARGLSSDALIGFLVRHGNGIAEILKVYLGMTAKPKAGQKRNAAMATVAGQAALLDDIRPFSMAGLNEQQITGINFAAQYNLNPWAIITLMIKFGPQVLDILKSIVETFEEGNAPSES